MFIKVSYYFSMNANKKVAVLFAGGSGKRLWPLSTADTPKQINSNFSKKSMLVDAYNRALRIFPKENIIVVTTEQLLPATKGLLPLDDKNLIVQPRNADTAAAMCLATMYIETVFPESIAVFLYSDQYIGDEDKFDQAVLDALNAVNDNDQLVIIGTKPKYANTGFGYIKKGKETSNAKVCHADGFIEKPELSVAKQLVSSGDWLWNTGIKVWRISTLLGAIKSAAPDMYKMMLDLRTEIGGKSYWQRLHEWYEQLQSVSFETVIATKLSQLFVLEADYYWEDIGDWQTVYRISPKDDAGNVVRQSPTEGIVRLVDTKNSLIMSTTGQKVVLLDVDDLIVVQTKDVLLICKKEVTPRVKEVAE